MLPARLAAIVLGASFLGGLGCDGQPPITPVPYTCGTTGDSVPDPATWVSVGDPADCPDVRSLEPKMPEVPSDPSCTLIASRHTDDQTWIPEESNDSAK